MDTQPRVAVREAVITYRYLRIAIVSLMALLGSSIALTSWSAKWCWQSSISHYFYTTTHAVFVASLCAMGILLIVYRGSTPLEDILLDFSGALAFVVAFVPTHPEQLCNPGGPGLPTTDDPTSGVGNNLEALVIGSIVGLGAYWLIRTLRPSQAAARPHDPASVDRMQTPELKIWRWIEQAPGWLKKLTTLAQEKSPWILLILLTAWVLFFLLCRDEFKKNGHNIAAVVMFGGFIAVVFHYAYYAAREGRGKFAGVYLAIAVCILGTLIAAVVLSQLRPGGWTILVEALLILEFAAFWFVQTIDLWDEQAYSETTSIPSSDQLSGS